MALFPLSRKASKKRSQRKLFPVTETAKIRYLRQVLNDSNRQNSDFFSAFETSITKTIISQGKSQQSGNIANFSNEIFNATGISDALGGSDSFFGNLFGGIIKKGLSGSINSAVTGKKSSEIQNIATNQLYSSLLKGLQKSKRNL